MYIQKVVIDNIRAIEHLEMDFTGREAGWHVLIGDNGSGKSSVVRGISCALCPPNEDFSIARNFVSTAKRIDFEKTQIFSICSLLLSNGENQAVASQLFGDYEKGTLQKANIDFDRLRDVFLPDVNDTKTTILNNKLQSYHESHQIHFKNSIYSKFFYLPDFSNDGLSESDKFTFLKAKYKENILGFAAAYGPFRRLTGVNPDLIASLSDIEKPFSSAFSEGVALTEALDWLKDQEFKALKNPQAHQNLVDDYRNFINLSGLLINGEQFIGLNEDGEPQFTDKRGVLLPVSQLSDGFRSILSLTFDLLSHITRKFGAENVFKNLRLKENPTAIIDLPGVVLIDEVDAHLHPNWQVRIGEWFTKTFPKIQFIVTTHSPLICRACGETGVIYRMSVPGTGSDEESREITGVARERLIYGNVLDAFGTEVFGRTVRSAEGAQKLLEYEALRRKSMEGETSDEEENRLNRLQQIFSTGRP